MTIACLGWGSLCWDPQSLPVVGDWHEDGPFLPVEFTRVSSDGRITLVLTDGVQALPVLWAELDATDLDQAISALANREDVRRLGAIGRWPNGRTQSSDRWDNSGVGHRPRHRRRGLDGSETRHGRT
jgi:hypothetical protein